MTHLWRDPATGRYELVLDDGTVAGADVAKADDEPEFDEEPATVVKAVDEQQYLLCVAWEPGKHDHIAKGVDGHRDFMDEENVELAAWALVAKHAGGVSGIQHASYFDPSLAGDNHARVVESYIYRGPDWTLSDTAGEDVVVKSGAWLVGLLCDDAAWAYYKAHPDAGVSVQGSATRRTVRRAEA